NRSRVPDSGVVRIFRGAVATPDISYVNTEIVSPNIAATNLLILGPDTYEPNESRLTPADLGSFHTVNVPHLAIFPDANEHPGVPADQDWFRVVADATGTLDFQVRFKQYNPALLPGGGNLNIEVTDAAGNVIAGFGVNDATDDERVRIP